MWAIIVGVGSITALVVVGVLWLAIVLKICDYLLNKLHLID